MVFMTLLSITRHVFVNVTSRLRDLKKCKVCTIFQSSDDAKTKILFDVMITGTKSGLARLNVVNFWKDKKMKTFLITLATASTLIAGAANAASTSNSDGEVRVFNPNQQTLFDGAALDLEPTASINAMSADGQVFSGTQMINGRDADIRYTIEGGEKNIISKSFRSSDR